VGIFKSLSIYPFIDSEIFKANKNYKKEIADESSVNSPDFVQSPGDDKNEIQNTKGMPISVQAERIIINSFKDPNKMSRYFKDDVNQKPTSDKKYHFYSNHSFNIEAQKVILMCN